MLLKTHGLRKTQVELVPTRMRQESVLSAKGSQRSKAELKSLADLMMMLGLMIANQVEIHLFKIIQMPELADHTKVLVSSVKDSQRSKAELNMMVTPKLGLMTAIQVETHSFKPMAALAL